MRLSNREAWWRSAVLAALFGCFTGCGGDGNGNGSGVGPDQEPTGEFAGQAQAVLDVTDQYFRDNPAVTSLDAVSSFISAVGITVNPVIAAMALGGSDLSSFVEALDGAEFGIPQELKGTVWVLQESPFQYVEDPGQVGPAEGVRFLMYDIDLVSGQPSTPLQPIGHLDIIESAEDTADADFVVTIDDAPLLDLVIDATTGQTLQMTVSGSISNGVEPLDVLLVTTGTVDQGTFDVDAEVRLRNSKAEIDVTMAATGTLASPSITTGTNVFIPGTFFLIGFFSEWDGSSFDGSVSVGADIVAFISGTENDITLEPTGEGGATQEDLVGLELMFEGIDRMFDDSLGIIGLVFAVVGFSLL